jgi:enterochelin esterase-like enzyme
MLEPQSTVFFVLLVVVFIGVLWWMLVTRHLAVRILAALLAFASAMMFGVATVNKYYDYYQNWGAAISDLTNQGAPGTTVQAATSDPGTGFSAYVGHHIDLTIARQLGLTLSLRVHGHSSGITRTVYVFLPPEYFKPGFYQKYRFPVIELIHGFPGQPQDWLTVLGVNAMLDSLVRQHRAKPAVLVMPDANGGRGISLQCLNQHGGPQDDTYLASDLPAYIARQFRVQPPGTGWGIAGYSEGGFCAANLGLQHGRVYSYAGVLSGYFRPSDNQLPRLVSPFGKNRRLARLSIPVDLLRSLPIGRPVPQFWLGAGRQDPVDVHSSETFAQLLQLRQPAVTIRLVPDGGHTMLTWRQLMPPMLRWMTNGLAEQVAQYNSPAARARRAAAAAAAVAKTSRLGAKTSRLGAKTSRLGAKTSRLGAKTSRLGAKTSRLGQRKASGQQHRRRLPTL